MKNKDLLTYFCMDLKNFWNLKCTRSVHEIKKVLNFFILWISLGEIQILKI